MITAFIKNRSRTFWYVIAGLISGLSVGHLIGGIGVVMLGFAFGIPTAIVLAVGGAIVGYRAGRRTNRRSKEAAN